MDPKFGIRIILLDDTSISLNVKVIRLKTAGEGSFVWDVLCPLRHPSYNLIHVLFVILKSSNAFSIDIKIGIKT